MSAYSSSITTFSPSGALFQIDYASEAVKRGTSAVAVKGKDCAVLACEKRSQLKLQDPRITPSKICEIDDNVVLAFAGLNADARVLVDKARVEAQSHKLNMEDAVSVKYLTKYVAGIQQRYTQTGGVRPFGLSTLIIGFDPKDDQPHLYQTEPSGVYTEWKANAIGRSSKTLRELLEKKYEADMDRDQTIRLAVKCLLEVVQTGTQNIELAIMHPGKKVEYLEEESLKKFVDEIEAEKAAEEAEKKRKSGE